MGLVHSLRSRLGRLRRLRQGFRHYWYDFRAFSAAAAGADNWRTTETDHALLVKQYHRIEKGLALPNPRPGFGARVIADVIDLVRGLERTGGAFFHGQGARATLQAYRRDAVCTEELGRQIDSFNEGLVPEGLPAAGADHVTLADIRQASAIDFEAFARSRYSVRDYTGDPVPEAAIREAVAIAMKSPRVCNRGTARCHAILDRATMERALSHQNGNAGFGDQAGAVLIITSDRRGFLDYGERNQCWIDGGLFAMTLAYALHAQGYGSCMLNWSVTSERDKALRREIPIPGHEAIITFMAVGVMKPEFRVAISPREPVETAFNVIGPRRNP
jgi:nitroreductase